MRSRRHPALLAVLLAATLAGCATTGGPPPAAGPGTPVSGSVPATTVTTPATPGGFSGTDTAWLQLTIAMDERIIQVFDLLSDRVGDPELRALVSRFETAHRDTLRRLRALHDRSGGPTTNPHEGHDMPGMATQAQLAAVRRATGRTAADLFAELTRAHLDQSVRLARAEREHGVEPATRTVAAEIERTRADQRAELDRLLPTEDAAG
ncbi:DUF305 domain-containing protein [Plantactinospora sonchi]|uniref:DUF305 domain-containing protein n=1 Tax=Plantactinospora sonchi TaxID=1544735 RepID=A0ABU7RQC6_9ACTN